MACPYFMPVEKHDLVLWPHPVRLPLGGGWKGACTAPNNEGECPSDDQLRDNCNVGYPRNCLRRPADAIWDASRFGVSKESEQRILLYYVCEKNHLPVGHGILEYDLALSRWNAVHPDERLQRMAECYLETYLLRKNGPALAGRPELSHHE